MAADVERKGRKRESEADRQMRDRQIWSKMITTADYVAGRI